MARHIVLALALLPAAAAAQTPPAHDAMVRLLFTDAARHLTSSSPVVRGEAALVLATSGIDRHHDACAEIARDPAAEASLRGIVALGYLAAPGTQNQLDALLDESSNRVQPAGIAAAFALGTLPDDRAGATVARHLVRFQESSMKRQRDVLLALVVALAMRGSTNQRAALLQLRGDDAIKDGTVRAALLHALARIPGAIGPDDVAATLAANTLEERRALLECLAAGALDPDASLLPELERVADRDRDVVVRSRALATLTRLRHLPALDVALHAVRSHDAVEVEQGVKTALLLGTSPVRRVVERQLDYLPQDAQAALLRAFTGPMSTDFQAACLRLAREPRTAPALRTAASLALAQARAPESQALLRQAFAAHPDRDGSIALAQALIPPDGPRPSLDELLLTDKPDALAFAPSQLLALLLANHPQAMRFCDEQLQRKDLPPVAATNILRAVRQSRLGLPAPSLLQLLPEPVRSLL